MEISIDDLVLEKGPRPPGACPRKPRKKGCVSSDERSEDA